MERFGICHLPYMPLRSEPSHKSENVSQLLFGEVFKIIDTYDSEWYFIEIEMDKYRGWITSNNLKYLNYKDFKECSLNQRYFSSEMFQLVVSNKSQFYISYGSPLPFFVDHKFAISNLAFEIQGKVIDTYQKKDTNWIISEAEKFLGVPYLWGGKNAFGLDCSGFVQLIYKVYGIDLPRDAYQQYDLGQKIDINEFQTGDLAFFKNKNDRIIHVGLLKNNHQIIHASGEVRIDTIDDKGIYNEELRSYTHYLEAVKRLL